MSISQVNAATLSSDQIKNYKKSFGVYLKTLEKQIKWAQWSLSLVGESLTVAAARKLYGREASAVEIKFVSKHFNQDQKSRFHLAQTVNSSPIVEEFIQTLFAQKPASVWSEHDFRIATHHHVLFYFNLDPSLSIEQFMKKCLSPHFLSFDQQHTILAHALFAQHCFEQHLPQRK